MIDAREWLTERIVSSDLTKLFFELRDERGLDADEAAKAVFLLADAFMLGECLKLAIVLGEIRGREHVVAVRSPEGSLLHAYFACVPQHPGEPPKGACVDVLGRQASLRDSIETMRVHFGPVIVGMATETPADFLTDQERGHIRRLAATLPWTRPFADPDTAAEDLIALVREAGWGNLPEPAPSP